jgi:toxin ParE1/3/4
MAEVIWTGPAKRDLEEIIGYIADRNPAAASRVAKRIIAHTRQLRKHPLSGPRAPEVEGDSVRQIVEAPCRIFYKVAGEKVYILHLLRFERLFRVARFGGILDDTEYS